MTFQPTKLHIIAFDIPWPANYGGVIDIFHKIRWLHQSGVSIILHCFQYGRNPVKELNDLCEEVHYYARKTGLATQFSTQPYIVRSRTSSDLVHRLLQDHHPILCEGLHCTSFMASPLFHDRVIYVRTTNVEHHYYRQLAKKETHLIRRIYYRIEAIRLRYYEKVLRHATHILAISPADQHYFEQHYGKGKVTGIYAFHPYDKVISIHGSGDYFLFHGKLDVPENYHAAMELLSIFREWAGKPLKIAGMNPPPFLIHAISIHPAVILVADPTTEEMDDLIAGAHAHLLITHQATGLKLKLLSALFRGRFVLTNDNMVHKTGLESLCFTGSSLEALRQSMIKVEPMVFGEEEMVQRRKVLETRYSNSENLHQLMAIIAHPE